MSPKDRQIIKSNPGASAYELHTTKGLSKGGFEEMVAIADSETDNFLKAGRPTLTPDNRKSLPAQPHLAPHLQTESSQVTLKAKNGTGRGTLMDKKQALKMVQKYPAQYEIV